MFPEAMLKDMEDGSRIVTLKNGFYYMLKKTISALERGSQEGEMKLIALQLIQHNYDSENKYLKNELNPYFNIAFGVKVSENSNITKEVLELGSADPPLYLYFDNNRTATLFSLPMVVGAVGWFFCFFLLFLTLLSVNLQKKERQWLGFFFLVTSIGAIVGLLGKYYAPNFLNVFPLFLSENSELPLFFNSLGMLALSSIALLCISAFFYQRIHLHLHSDYVFAKKMGIYLGFFVFITNRHFFCFLPH